MLGGIIKKKKTWYWVLCGFIIKVSDSQKTGLKANLEFKGEDAYGNEFTSSLNGEKW